MKFKNVFSILGIAIALSLLMTVIPATPVLAAPVVILSPTFGAVGTKVTVTGTNFASYIGNIVHIFFGGVEVAGSPLVVLQDGILTTTFAVSHNAAPGAAYVTVTDAGGNQLAKSNPFTVAGIDIKIDPEAGDVGTNVTVHGKGLYVNGKVTFYYWSSDTKVKVGEDIASPTGECTYSFTVPNSSSGSHKVVVEDAYGSEAKAYFSVTPAIVLQPTSASAGAEVTVSGTGFGSTNDVTIYFSALKVTTQRTDGFGSFEAVFTVPKLRSRIGNLEVRDKSGNILQTQFTVAAGISLSQTTGHIGEELTVNGTSFLGSLPVVINYDSTPIAEGVTHKDGAFSLSFSVPIGIHGSYQITASDGTNSVTSLFSVESVAPLAPKLILLENPGKVKPGAHFDWDDVSDPSGVTYTFQVAADANFSSVIFEKTGFASSEYVITKQDTLRSSGEETPYYWRVKAVDGASNESQWSTAQAFYYFHGWPRWLQYTVVVIIWILTGFFCFKVGRSKTFRGSGNRFPRLPIEETLQRNP